MHFILKLEATQDLSSVLLEHLELVDDFDVRVTLSSDLVELIIEAQIL